MTLLRFAACLRVAHHIPGRIRLGVAGGAEQPEWGDDPLGKARRFSQALTGVSGIRSVRLNPLARSCTVEYDPSAIPPAAWQDLLSGTGSAAADKLRAIFLAAESAAAKG
ncbi:heavy-metal-associated domain-containing protein [Telmatospirillum siberiense]|uniref:Cation transporter n=1 Tax=Telmatospirillum siberiense TaxID=382514 RepID=A0A2N3PWG4_9PROT|nr:heavy-metal-associated domain-containing protein [Telmatospirillum siberiense]PKU24715.1 hypothetical protein CWS72_10300 [Telmatospirillum siberiense]